MSTQRFEINSIAGGLGHGLYDNTPGTFHAALAIDPDLQSASTIRPSGDIRPVGFSKFSGTEITGKPMWIVTHPRTQATHNGYTPPYSYVYASDGKMHSFDSTLTMMTQDAAGTAFPKQITNGTGAGFVYHNNFLYGIQYGATGDLNNTAKADVFQYGGLDQGASTATTLNVWTGAKFGKAALTNITYPSIRGVTIPNHPMFVHPADGDCYIGDVIPDTYATTNVRGAGCLHRLATKTTTIQGDTDDSSGYAVLILPVNFYPTAICNWGTDIAVAAIQISPNSTTLQGPASIFLWDTVNPNGYYQQIRVADAVVTAMKNMDGTLLVFTGNLYSGNRVLAYEGGDGLRQVEFFEESNSPFAGAVDTANSRVTFGGYASYPIDAACALSIGSKEGKTGATFNTYAWSGSGTTPTVTALKYVEQQTAGQNPRAIFGWTDSGGNGLDKFDSATGAIKSIFRSQVFSVGAPFNLLKIRIPLDETVQANLSIVPKIYVDNLAVSYTLPTINTTNSSGFTEIIFKRPKMASSDSSGNSNIEIRGNDNFFIEFTWSNIRATAIKFPVTIDVEVFSDYKSS